MNYTNNVKNYLHIADPQRGSVRVGINVVKDLRAPGLDPVVGQHVPLVESVETGWQTEATIIGVAGYYVHQCRQPVGDVHEMM